VTKGLTLTHLDGQIFMFDAGALCLELVVTGGRGRRAKHEVLHTPADFVQWAMVSRLDLARYGVHPAMVRVGASDLRLVRSLREAIWISAINAAGGGRPEPSDLATINAVAANTSVVPQLDPISREVVWRDPVTARQLIAEIARDAVVTFAEPTIKRVRQCAAPNCYLVYLDTSRPGQRRWCSMQRCGNRKKVTDYRLRQRLAHVDS